MRGTFDWGVLDEKRTHPNTNIEGPKWDFNPPSVIMCHNRVGAVAYVGKVCLLKSKAAECTKEDPCKILAIGADSRPLRRIYSLVFRHRKILGALESPNSGAQKCIGTWFRENDSFKKYRTFCILFAIIGSFCFVLPHSCLQSICRTQCQLSDAFKKVKFGLCTKEI